MNDQHQMARYLDLPAQGGGAGGGIRGPRTVQSSGSYGPATTGTFTMPQNMSGRAPSMTYADAGKGPGNYLGVNGSGANYAPPPGATRSFGQRDLSGNYASPQQAPTYSGYMGATNPNAMTRDQWRGRNQNQNFNSRYGMANTGGLTPNRVGDAATNQYFLARQQYLGGR